MRYYLQEDAIQEGPLNGNEVLERWRGGRIRASATIRREGEVTCVLFPGISPFSGMHRMLCPGCQRGIVFSRSLVGRRARCTSCGHEFTSAIPSEDRIIPPPASLDGASSESPRTVETLTSSVIVEPRPSWRVRFRTLGFTTKVLGIGCVFVVAAIFVWLGADLWSHSPDAHALDQARRALRRNEDLPPVPSLAVASDLPQEVQARADRTLMFIESMVSEALRFKYMCILHGMWGSPHAGFVSLEFPGDMYMPADEYRRLVASGIENVDPRVLEFFFAQIPSNKLDDAMNKDLKQQLEKTINQHVQGWWEDIDETGSLLELLGKGLFYEGVHKTKSNMLITMREALTEHLLSTYGASGVKMDNTLNLTTDADAVLAAAEVWFREDYLLDIRPAKPGAVLLTDGGDIDEYREILDKGAVVNDQAAARALIRTCNIGQYFTVRYLLERGVDPNARNVRQTLLWDKPSGSTALHEVAKTAGRLNLEIAKSLLAAGATVDVEDQNGRTPIDVARGRSYRDQALIDLLKSEAGKRPPITYADLSPQYDREFGRYPWREHLLSNHLYECTLVLSDGTKLPLELVLDFGWQTRRANGWLRAADGGVTRLETTVEDRYGFSIKEFDLEDVGSGRPRPLRHFYLAERISGQAHTYQCIGTSRTKVRTMSFKDRGLAPEDWRTKP